MERLILILILCLAFNSLAQDCSRYVKNEKLPKDVCLLKVEMGTNTTFQLRECQEGKVCDILDEEDTESKCGNWYTTPIKFPGEYCRNHTECFSGVCLNSTCVGKNESGDCENDTICNPGLYCDVEAKKCKKVRKINEACNEKMKCASYLVCDKAKCIVHASLDIDQEADHPSACKSYYVSKGKCKKGPTLKRAEGDPEFGPIACPKIRECTYTFDGKEEFEPCICGITENGTKFCPPGRGDIVLDDVISILTFG
jgi:hypothetical protein